MMETTTKGIISKRLNDQEVAKGILATAILIGIAVNLISTSIYTYLSLEEWSSGWAVIVFTFIFLAFGLIWALPKALGERNINLVLKGFFVWDRKSNKLISADKYDFSRSITRSIASVLVEDEALAAQWKSEPLSLVNPIESANLSTVLIDEATEYYVLKKLSMLLSEYYQNPKHNNAKVKHLTREELGAVISRNRLMTLITKSPEERPFIKKKIDSHEKMTVLSKVSKERGEAIVDGLITSEGVIYDPFELTLPPDTTINRTHRNRIEISNKLFKLSMGFHYPTWTEPISSNFTKLLGGKIISENDIHNYSYEIYIDIQFSRTAFLMKSRWQHCSWIEEFIEELDDSFSHQKFFDNIGWKPAETAFELLSNR